MNQSNRWLLIAVLGAVISGGLTGCAAQRKPLATIEPSYSHIRALMAMDPVGKTLSDASVAKGRAD